MNGTFLALAMAAALPLQAQTDRTPDLATTVPAGWQTDRYDPCGFSLANGVNGRNNVLQTSVCASDALANRPAGYNSTFYNTQGKKIGIDGVGVAPSGSQKVSLDLWVNSSWATSANGLVSTGMWARLNQVNSDVESAAAYPILGFTNTGGAGTFRYFDSLLGYQTLGATVNYDAWNTFEFDFNQNVISAYVNGQLQYTETTAAGTDRLTTMFVNTSNYGDVDAPDGGQYTADWSNTPPVTAAPEPATLGLMATGLIGIVAVRRRKKNAK